MDDFKIGDSVHFTKKFRVEYGDFDTVNEVGIITYLYKDNRTTVDFPSYKDYKTNKENLMFSKCPFKIKDVVIASSYPKIENPFIVTKVVIKTDDVLYSYGFDIKSVTTNKEVSININIFSDGSYSDDIKAFHPFRVGDKVKVKPEVKEFRSTKVRPTDINGVGIIKRIEGWIKKYNDVVVVVDFNDERNVRLLVSDIKLVTESIAKPVELSTHNIAPNIENNKRSKIEIDDVVRVKESVENPTYGWDNISHKSLGLVKDLIDEKDIKIYFSEKATTNNIYRRCWVGKSSEMEVVFRKGDTVKIKSSLDIIQCPPDVKFHIEKYGSIDAVIVEFRHPADVHLVAGIEVSGFVGKLDCLLDNIEVVKKVIDNPLSSIDDDIGIIDATTSREKSILAEEHTMKFKEGDRVVLTEAHKKQVKDFYNNISGTKDFFKTHKIFNEVGIIKEIEIGSLHGLKTQMYGVNFPSFKNYRVIHHELEFFTETKATIQPVLTKDPTTMFKLRDRVVRTKEYCMVMESSESEVGIVDSLPDNGWEVYVKFPETGLSHLNKDDIQLAPAEISIAKFKEGGKVRIKIDLKEELIKKVTEKWTKNIIDKIGIIESIVGPFFTITFITRSIRYGMEEEVVLTAEYIEPLPVFEVGDKVVRTEAHIEQLRETYGVDINDKRKKREWSEDIKKLRKIGIVEEIKADKCKINFPGIISCWKDFSAIDKATSEIKEDLELVPNANVEVVLKEETSTQETTSSPEVVEAITKEELPSKERDEMTIEIPFYIKDKVSIKDGENIKWTGSGKINEGIETRDYKNVNGVVMGIDHDCDLVVQFPDKKRVIFKPSQLDLVKAHVSRTITTLTSTPKETVMSDTTSTTVVDPTPTPNRILDTLDKVMKGLVKKIPNVVFDITTGAMGLKTTEGIMTLVEPTADEGYSLMLNPIDALGITIPAVAIRGRYKDLEKGDIVVGPNNHVGFFIGVENGNTKILTMSGTKSTIKKINNLVLGEGVLVVRNFVNSPWASLLIPALITAKEAGVDEDILSMGLTGSTMWPSLKKSVLEDGSIKAILPGLIPAMPILIPTLIKAFKGNGGHNKANLHNILPMVGLAALVGGAPFMYGVLKSRGVTINGVVTTATETVAGMNYAEVLPTVLWILPILIPIIMPLLRKDTADSKGSMWSKVLPAAATAVAMKMMFSKKTKGTPNFGGIQRMMPLLLPAVPALMPLCMNKD